MIFLQAAARQTGPAAALLELAEIGVIELFVSDSSMEELRDVLNRPSLQHKFPALTTVTVHDFVERIKFCSVCSANVPSVFPLERDPKDAKYIDLAFATKADFLVTRDKDILDLRDTDQLTQSFDVLGWQFKIVDPIEILSYLRDEGSSKLP